MINDTLLSLNREYAYELMPSDGRCPKFNSHQTPPANQARLYKRKGASCT